MDFLDSLKNIKKEMQVDTAKKSNKNEAKQHNLKTQEEPIDKQMQEIFLKQEKLQDEFSEFIKNANIKKI
ncbi:hypothetical protein LNU06_04070 [Campylobacter sp. VicNov18]|uniref:hypothetical protein n=1 Tax=Campylobacter bilis TaxID=2691918 RepID=UPI00130E1C0F|nr:hypothetical protein [Campylobacter bilis]MPV63711.1 hypothetical protein [Campylobacter hepaticus]MBM0637212.1 hypothetical protein [Campylobacter bilis]MCC8277931.1 hypothetical protein [Campylobacter bilis]MCC8298862.1 hypothetical protein [Campylobacter bilis]MCC8300841.1 hypothetical protein [Campylobacter bilis]